MTQEEMKAQISALKSMLESSRREREVLAKSNIEVAKLNADLLSERAEAVEVHARIMSEKCPSDEIHCTCVPVLREELASLKADWKVYRDTCAKQDDEIGRLRAALEVYAERSHWRTDELSYTWTGASTKYQTPLEYCP